MRCLCHFQLCLPQGVCLGVELLCPVLWPPHAKSWLIGKDSDAGRDWGQEEKGMTEDEMAGWHYWLNGRESEWTPGVGDGQGGLVCCNSWGRKESDTTEWLNWTELNWGTLLAVQWLRLCASNGGGMGSITGWGTKITHTVRPKKKKKALLNYPIWMCHLSFQDVLID